jgi:hypothetical protein
VKIVEVPPLFVSESKEIIMYEPSDENTASDSIGEGGI